jgi:hypothetical protein
LVFGFWLLVFGSLFYIEKSHPKTKDQKPKTFFLKLIARLPRSRGDNTNDDNSFDSSSNYPVI